MGARGPEQGTPPGELTARQKKFVEEYQVDTNATAAAIRSGYSPTHADAVGSRLSRHPPVADALARLAADRAQKAEIDGIRVLREAALIALADIREAYDDQGRLLPPHLMPEQIARAIQAIETDEGPDGETRTRRVRFCDKLKGIELLGKNLALWIDRVEHSGSVSITIQSDVTALEIDK